MLAPVYESEDSTAVLPRGGRFARLRMIGATAPYRTKCDAEPALPLPRWTNWALVAWTLCAAATYTVILARWWE